MRVETTDEGLRAVDGTKTSIAVETAGWSPASAAPSLYAARDSLEEDARPPDAVVTGTVEELRFPPFHATVRSVESGEVVALGSDVGPIRLKPDEYVLHVQGSLGVQVCFDSAVEIAQPDYERLAVSFPEPTPVAVGFVARVDDAVETVTVPRTPAGVATALSAMPAGNRTTTPDWTFPTMRGPPPRVAFGEEDVPDAVRERFDGDRVELVVPPNLSYLFPAAPLVHALAATVSVEPGVTPTLRAGDVTRELPELPSFQYAVARLLKTTFFCDCLVRSVGPYGEPLERVPLLSELGLDPDALYGRPVPERVARYLRAPTDAFEDRFPEWHLSMYVEPTFEHVRTLPHLLADLPYLFLPTVAELEEDEWLDRSLGDFYRASTGDVASIDLVRPSLGPGRVHGWLADGVPIDVFKTIPEAYENRAEYVDAGGGAISVVAVLNDREMREEHDDAAARYRERAEELDIDIEVRENLTVDELARTVESRYDLLHFIGHCETDGLRCADGNLSASSVAESNVQTFFLNACGSYYEGIELVRKGSVAGGVTFNEVLERQATTVGATFACLLTQGYCIERALDKARRRIMTGKDYAVVGDGTHVLTQSDDIVPPDISLHRVGSDEYRIEYCVDGPRMPGAAHHCFLRDDDGYALVRTDEEYVVGPDRFAEFLGYSEYPILYDGDLRWREELRELLG